MTILQSKTIAISLRNTHLFVFIQFYTFTILKIQFYSYLSFKYYPNLIQLFRYQVHKTQILFSNRYKILSNLNSMSNSKQIYC